MRQLVAVIVVAACKKEEPAHAPLPPPPSSVVAHADAGAADAALADAGAPLVDLLRAVPITITVSSTVVNPAIVPAHLVDRDLGTAWNSATGELVGAWIEATLPSGARAAEIRMTVGHTGHGKHGEDYFTMNPRIKGVSVWSGDTLLGNVKLDVSNRALQTIADRAWRIHHGRREMDHPPPRHLLQILVRQGVGHRRILDLRPSGQATRRDGLSHARRAVAETDVF